MGSLGPLRLGLLQYRKRKQLSLDGTVGGIQPNRFRPGLRGTVPGRSVVQGGEAAPRDYMSFHPDAYDPHPGEMVSPNSLYSPYRIEVAHIASDEVDAFAPGLQPVLSRSVQADVAILQESGLWFSRRHPNEGGRPHAPEVIPEDHDVMFEGPIGPTIVEPLDAPGDDDAIRDIWNRIIKPPDYDSGAMTHELFDQAMGDAIRAGRTLESPSDGVGNVNNNWFPTIEDQIAAQDDGVSPDQSYAAFGDVESLGMAADLIYEPDSHIGIDPSGAMEPGFADACPFENGGAMPDVGQLEQIAEELASSIPSPDPMSEEQLYEDELLMNPWNAPGMGPMGPGSGPMGPLGPIM